MKPEDEDLEDDHFRDAENHETPPPEGDQFHDNEEDGEPDDEDATPLVESPKMPTDEDRKRYANMYLDRLEKINDAEKEDWYVALLSVEIDKYNGDMDAAFDMADELFSQHPNPPKHEEEPTPAPA